MKVFDQTYSDNTSKLNNQILIQMTVREGRELLKMCEVAAKAQKRKQSWHAIYRNLEMELPIY